MPPPPAPPCIRRLPPSLLLLLLLSCCISVALKLLLLPWLAMVKGASNWNLEKFCGADISYVHFDVCAPWVSPPPPPRLHRLITGPSNGDTETDRLLLVVLLAWNF